MPEGPGEGTDTAYVELWDVEGLCWGGIANGASVIRGTWRRHRHCVRRALECRKGCAGGACEVETRIGGKNGKWTLRTENI